MAEVDTNCARARARCEKLWHLGASAITRGASKIASLKNLTTKLFQQNSMYANVCYFFFHAQFVSRARSVGFCHCHSYNLTNLRLFVVFSSSSSFAFRILLLDARYTRQEREQVAFYCSAFNILIVVCTVHCSPLFSAHSAIEYTHSENKIIS